MDDKNQSWETCKYSAKGNHIGCVSEYFSCLNIEIAEMGVYRKLTLQKEDGSTVVSSTLFNHSHLNPGGVIDMEWPETAFLQSRIKRSLAGCRHCKFYEPRKGEQTQFGKLKKGKIGDFDTYSIELVIVENK